MEGLAAGQVWSSADLEVVTGGFPSSAVAASVTRLVTKGWAEVLFADRDGHCVLASIRLSSRGRDLAADLGR